MDTIAVGRAEGVVLHNPTPDKSAWAWREGLWCDCTLGSSITVLVGWDGLIVRALNAADEQPSGHWRAES